MTIFEKYSLYQVTIMYFVHYGFGFLYVYLLPISTYSYHGMLERYFVWRIFPARLMQLAAAVPLICAEAGAGAGAGAVTAEARKYACSRRSRSVGNLIWKLAERGMRVFF